MAEKSQDREAHDLASCHFEKVLFPPLGMVSIYESFLVSCLELLWCAEKQILFSFPHHWIFKIEDIPHSGSFSYLCFTKVLTDVQNGYWM